MKSREVQQHIILFCFRLFRSWLLFCELLSDLWVKIMVFVSAAFGINFSN